MDGFGISFEDGLGLLKYRLYGFRILSVASVVGSLSPAGEALVLDLEIEVILRSG